MNARPSIRHLASCSGLVHQEQQVVTAELPGSLVRNSSNCIQISKMSKPASGGHVVFSYSSPALPMHGWPRASRPVVASSHSTPPRGPHQGTNILRNEKTPRTKLRPPPRDSSLEACPDYKRRRRAHFNWPLQSGLCARSHKETVLNTQGCGQARTHFSL